MKLPATEACPACRVRVGEEDICCYCGGCMGNGLSRDHVECCHCPEWFVPGGTQQEIQAAFAAMVREDSEREPRDMDVLPKRLTPVFCRRLSTDDLSLALAAARYDYAHWQNYSHARTVSRRLGVIEDECMRRKLV
jgi:hypothetical protein